MLAARMIPALWLRLVVLIGFTVFVAFKGIYWLAGLCVLFILLSAWQLASAYKQKAYMDEADPQ